MLLKGNKRYTFEVLQCGQPRAYADSILKIRVTAEYIPYVGKGEEYVPFSISKEKAIELIRVCRNDRFQTEEEDPEWHVATLKNCASPSDGIWELTIISQYTG